MRTGARPPIKALVHDVTISRALDTIYQNLTGRPILVTVTVRCFRESSALARATALADIGPTSPPSIFAGGAGAWIETDEPEDVLDSITFIVPNLYYYRLRAVKVGAGSTIAFDAWVETDL